jgi:hypothetical protein
MTFQYTMVFKTIKFDENWNYGAWGENVIYQSIGEKEAKMWVMVEGPSGDNVGYEFLFTKPVMVGVSLYKNLVVIPKSNTDVVIPHPP